MKNKQKNKIPEIVIPKGYELDELLDMDEEEEESIYMEEVRIRFER